MRHFLDNEPIPGIENTYALMNQILPNLPLEAINETMGQLISDKNQALALFGPEKEGLVFPTKNEIVSLLTEVANEELTPMRIPYLMNLYSLPFLKGAVYYLKQKMIHGNNNLNLITG